jgi:hypothetical protein
MHAGLLATLQRRTRPPIALGILVAALCVAGATLLAGLLKQITPVYTPDVLYLLGILAVASVWGLWLGMATAVASTIALDYFLIPPTGSMTLAADKDWAVFVGFLAVALMAWLISKLARSLAIEVDARGEADLAADLARILLRAPDLKTAQQAAAQHLARTLQLPSAAIQPVAIPDDDHQMAFLLGAEFLAATGGDMTNFASADHLVGYAGLAPVPRDSGRISGNRHRPRRYNRDLNRVFYTSALISVRYAPESRTFYDRKRAEGKLHTQAVLALARRRVNVLWALIRDRRCFEHLPPPAKAA